MVGRWCFTLGTWATNRAFEQVVASARLAAERYRGGRLPTLEMVTARQPWGVIRPVVWFSVALGGWGSARLRLVLGLARRITLPQAILRVAP